MTKLAQALVGAQRRSRTDGWRMGRRKFMTLIGGLAIAWPLDSYAQQPQAAPPKRVGLLNLFGCPIPPANPFTRRLAELGWIEGQNFVFDCVSTVGRLDQLQALARELVSRRPDVIGAGPSNLVRALKQESTTIPIVMLVTGHPVENGLVTNLAQPEGNVTGVAFFSLFSKQMEFLTEIIPHLRRLALVTSAYLDTKAAQGTEDSVTITASKLGFAWERFRPAVANDIDEVFARIATEHFDAVVINPDPFTLPNATRLIELALRYRIPTAGPSSEWARGGLLLSYGQNVRWGMARGAEYINKVLRGAKPSELPVEQAAKIELAINLKTAKALGLTVPPSLLALANELIE